MDIRTVLYLAKQIKHKQTIGVFYICYTATVSCLFQTTMTHRQSGAKRFGPAQCDTLYKMAYRMKFRWNDMLSPSLLTLLELNRTAFNCPVGLSVGAMLSMTSAVCGPNTKIRVVNFNMPLNTYTICVCAPGGGKSVAFSKMVCEPSNEIFTEYGVNVLLESYSMAGLHRHHNEHRNYAIVSSDEGHRLITSICNKEGRNEGERALINKLWNGQGDKTTLKDSDRGFQSTSFSMAIFIQPQPLINEMLSMGPQSDGFYDRFIFIVEKPKIHVSTEQRDALQTLQQDYGCDFIIKLFTNMFEIHASSQTIYNLSQDAQAHYDSLLDEHATDFNSQYQTDSG